MPINQASLDRLKGAKLRPEKVAEILEQLCAVRDTFGAGDTHINLDYQDAGAPILAGDMIPVITIGLRQPTVEQGK